MDLVVAYLTVASPTAASPHPNRMLTCSLACMHNGGAVEAGGSASGLHRCQCTLHLSRDKILPDLGFLCTTKNV